MRLACNQMHSWDDHDAMNYSTLKLMQVTWRCVPRFRKRFALDVVERNSTGYWCEPALIIGAIIILSILSTGLWSRLRIELPVSGTDPASLLHIQRHLSKHWTKVSKYIQHITPWAIDNCETIYTLYEIRLESNYLNKCTTLNIKEIRKKMPIKSCA